MNDREVEQLWRQYKKGRRKGDSALRNRLIEHYLPLVRGVVASLVKDKPPQVRPEDLNSAGCWGLIEAVERFELDRGVKFETFAGKRIAGAALDMLRAEDWVPRPARIKARIIEQVQLRLRNKLNREPTQEELRRGLRLSRAEYKRLKELAAIQETVELERPWYESDAGRAFTELNGFVDKNQPQPEAAAIRKEIQEKLGAGFSRSEKLIIVLYYYENMSMAEIGKVLGKSEAMISYQHKRIIRRLKERNRQQLQGWLENN